MPDQTSSNKPGGVGRAGRPVRALDDADRRILGELVRDARTSIRTLAERIHISRANAYARVDRLLADGVITGFSARIAPERAGLGTSAYVSLSIEQNSWREVSAHLRELPFVEHAAMLGATSTCSCWCARRTTQHCARWSWSRSRACPASRRRAPGWCSTSSRGAAPTGPDAAVPEAQLTLLMPFGACPADLR